MNGQQFDKAALLVPLHLDGQNEGCQLWMQLDTGIWQTVFYERPFQLLNQGAYQVTAGSATHPSQVRYSGSLGDLPLERGQAQIMQGFGSEYPALQGDVSFGSIGLDLFRNYLLVLDFPNQRLAVLDSVDQLPPAWASEVEYVPATIQNGHYVIKSTVETEGVTQELQVFYDTGSSSWPLAVKPETWRSLTGRSGEEADNQRFSGPSWGNIWTNIGTALPGSLRLGHQLFNQPMLYYADSDAFNRNVLASLDGIIGNALFYDEYTVILDLKDLRFGFVRTKADQ